MELTYFQMYLITMLESFVFLLAVGGALLFFFGVFCFFDKNSSCPEKWTKEIKHSVCMWCGVTAIILGLFIPSKKDVAIIYLVPALVNNQDVQAIPPELAKLARVKLEEVTKEALK